MAEIGKIALALFLVGFWLFLPIGFLLFDIAGNDIITERTQDTGPIVFWDYISVYFSLLTFNIAGVSVYIKYIIWFLQFATAVFIAVMIRGN